MKLQILFLGYADVDKGRLLVVIGNPLSRHALMPPSRAAALV